jgi:hypothetical protein
VVPGVLALKCDMIGFAAAAAAAVYQRSVHYAQVGVTYDGFLGGACSEV